MFKKYKFAKVILLALSTALVAYGDDNAPSSKDFFEAYKSRDIKKMSNFFDDKIKFLGDPKFTNEQAKGAMPLDLSKKDLINCYEKLFSVVTPEEWLNDCNKMIPDFKTQDPKSPLNGLAKEGDWVFDLKVREARKGARKGYDEAVIFIFRKIEDEWKIVAMIADY